MCLCISFDFTVKRLVNIGLCAVGEVEHISPK